MLIRSLSLAGLLFLLLLSPWATPGWAQRDIRFEQYSPQSEIYWKDKLRRNPKDARGHFYLGRYYELVGRIPDAANSYKQATLYNPGWPEAFFQLGKTYRVLRRYQEAAVALQRAVILKSNYARAYHFLGLVKIDLGRYQEAADALVKAYTYDPGWAETYYDQTFYHIHGEFNEKETVLALIRYIYPVNQRLARLLYNRWARNNAGMKEYWETVSGRQLPADKGYQHPPVYGYQGPEEVGYQGPPKPNTQRRANQSAPAED